MILGVCTPPFDQPFHRLVAQWSHIVVRWEYWSDWFTLEESASGAWAAQPSPVWVVTAKPPTVRDARVARTLGVTGWVWTDLDLPPEGLPDTVAYRLRVNVSALPLDTVLEVAEALADTPARLDVWGTGGVDLPEGLPFGEDFPTELVDHLAHAEPYKCARGLRVVHFSGDIVRGCPFRFLAGTKATNVNAALEVLLSEAQGCPHGCYTSQAALADYLLTGKAVWTPPAARREATAGSRPKAL